MYKLKIAEFKNSQPEELLVLLENFKTTIDGTGTELVAKPINSICTLLHGEAIREFDEPASHNDGRTSTNLKFNPWRV